MNSQRKVSFSLSSSPGTTTERTLCSWFPIHGEGLLTWHTVLERLAIDQTQRDGETVDDLAAKSLGAMEGYSTYPRRLQDLTNRSVAFVYGDQTLRVRVLPLRNRASLKMEAPRFSHLEMRKFLSLSDLLGNAWHCEGEFAVRNIGEDSNRLWKVTTRNGEIYRGTDHWSREQLLSSLFDDSTDHFTVSVSSEEIGKCTMTMVRIRQPKALPQTYRF